MQIYDEKCWVYTSVRALELLRSPADVHFPALWVSLSTRCFRARNKSSTAMSAQKAKMCNGMQVKRMNGKNRTRIMQISLEIMSSEKCENVLIKHKSFA